jgi:GT2 family glycosyltransferase
VNASRPISLSCSIVSYHSPAAELQSALESLLDAIGHASAEGLALEADITLVDNSEAAELRPDTLAATFEKAASLGCVLRIEQGHGNVGYGRGHNLAIGPSRGDYFLVMNPDVVVEKEALTTGIRHLQQHPEIAVVSPAAHGLDGVRQYLCKRYPSVLAFAARGFFPVWLKRLFRGQLAHFEMHDLAPDEPHHDIPIVSGCFMLCRTAALQKVGGFDENYFLYFEDFDLSLRLRKVGRLAYLPAMRITHYGGHSARKGWRHIGMFIRSGLRFFNTWGWKLIQ